MRGGQSLGTPAHRPPALLPDMLPQQSLFSAPRADPTRLCSRTRRSQGTPRRPCLPGRGLSPCAVTLQRPGGQGLDEELETAAGRAVWPSCPGETAASASLLA